MTAMDMMTRRRTMMGPLPEWDFEWDYTKGLPENNGMTHTTSGTASSSMQSTYLKVTTGTSSSGNYYYPPSNNSQNTIEFKCAVTYGSSPNGYVRVQVTDGAHGIQVIMRPSSKTIFVRDTSDFSTCTVIGSLASSTYYTIKMVLDGTKGYVYLDGTLVYTALDITSFTINGTSTVWSWYGSSSTARYARLVNFKQKVGRI